MISVVRRLIKYVLELVLGEALAFFVFRSVVWSSCRPVVGAALELISRGNTGEALAFFGSGFLAVDLLLRGGEVEPVRGNTGEALSFFVSVTLRSGEAELERFSSSGKVCVAKMGEALEFFVSES